MGIIFDFFECLPTQMGNLVFFTKPSFYHQQAPAPYQTLTDWNDSVTGCCSLKAMSYKEDMIKNKEAKKTGYNWYQTKGYQHVINVPATRDKKLGNEIKDKLERCKEELYEVKSISSKNFLSRSARSPCPGNY